MLASMKKSFLATLGLLATCFVFLISVHQQPQLGSVMQGSLWKRSSDDETTEVQLEHCPCSRRLKKSTRDDQDNQEILFNETTCSSDAFARGPHQKVVAFSFYASKEKKKMEEKGYLEGIRGNLELMAKFYPGWTMRLYYDVDGAASGIQEFLCQLACSNDVLDLCDATKLPGTPMKDARKMFAMNWRFFPTLDPQVSFYASRDLDSRFSEREKAAVDEWLATPDKAFHFMRDHPYHGVKILGSGWGVKLDRSNTSSVRSKFAKAFRRAMQEDPIVWKSRFSHGHDQTFLAKYIWPWAKKNSIGHDAYFCKKYPYTKGFPTPRKREPNNFIASVVTQNRTMWKECPVKCRPKEHKDWTHC